MQNLNAFGIPHRHYQQDLSQESLLQNRLKLLLYQEECISHNLSRLSQRERELMSELEAVRAKVSAYTGQQQAVQVRIEQIRTELGMPPREIVRSLPGSGA